MLKKFNIFALALLIIGQTVLGPIGTSVAFAEESNADAIKETAAAEINGTEPDADVTGQANEDQSLEPEVVGEVGVSKDALKNLLDNKKAAEDYEDTSYAAYLQVVVEGQAVYDNDNATQEDVNTAVDKIERAIAALQQKTSTEGGDVDTVNEITPTTTEEPNTADGVKEEEEIQLFNAESMQADVTAGTTGIRLGQADGTVITNSTQIPSGYTPQKGDTVYLSYSFDITPTKAYGAGSTFEFQLPQTMIEEHTTGSFNQTRTIEENDYVGYKSTYNSSTKMVTVTLKDDLGNGVDGEITFNFQARFGNFADESKLDQDFKMPILGEGSVDLDFIFKPTTAGEAIAKTAGNVTRAADGAEMEWTIWVNTEGKEIVSGATVGDTLTGGHAFEPDSLVIEKYAVGLNGINKISPGTPVTYTSGSTAFPVTLDTGNFAYKLTYTTKVSEDPGSSQVRYSNTATFTNGGPAQKSSSYKDIKYGPSLEKSIPKNDKYEASWQIKYNWLGEDLSKKNFKKLTDSIPANSKGAKHEIQYDADNFKVYRVTLNADGQTAASRDPLTAGTHYTLTNNTETGFEIDFANDVVDNPRAAYLIEYNTQLDQEYVTDVNAGNITNTVIREDSNESKNATVTVQPNIFTKQRGEIDYANKLITWNLTIRAEQSLEHFIIDDTITTINKDGKTLTHKLAPWDTTDTAKVFEITSGHTPAINSGGTVGDEAFNMTFPSIAKGQTVTIKYKTKFDVEPNGGVARSYDNTAGATWRHPTTGKAHEALNKTAKYEPGDSSPTGNNGYKDNAVVDNANQVFSWKIGVNVNKEDINDATLEDTLGAGHELLIADNEMLKDAISVKLLTLGVGDERGTPGVSLDPVKWDVTPTEPDGKVTGFTLTFKDLDIDQNNQAYLIEYQTKDSDDVYGNGETESNKYKNSAILMTPNSGTYSYSSDATITSHANKLITKNANPQPASDTIEWTVTVNESNSKLGDITLTDKPSDNQKLLTNTFTKQKIKLNANGGTTPVGSAEPVDPSEISVKEDGSFELKLGELNREGYIIKYKTYFMGDPNEGENVSNTASINYSGATSAGTTAEGGDTKLFKYSSSDTNASGKRGTLKIKKVGVNPNTGETTVLEGVNFELLTLAEDVMAEGETDENGELIFEDMRYGMYKLRETTPIGYKTVGTVAFQMKDSTNFLETNVPYTITNVEDVLLDGCSVFGLTIKDVDDKPVASKNIQLKDANGDVKHTGTTNSEGLIEIPNTVLAGNYDVYDGDNKLSDDKVTVKYTDDCQYEIKPAPSCQVFTVTVKGETDVDGNDTFRENVELTLKYEDNTVTVITVTTDGNGMFTLPSASTKAGKYTVYEGQQFLGEIIVTYKGNCEATVQQAPVCPVFTLTVKDVDGEISAGQIVTIKDQDNNVIKMETTDSNGQIQIDDLAPNKYTVYDEHNDVIDTFVVDITCAAEVQPDRTLSCPNFTVTINNESGDARPNVTVTVKGTAGNNVATSTTDQYGKIQVPTENLPAGKYNVYEGGIFLGEIEVKYTGNTNCGAVLDTTVSSAGTCPVFMLTVNDRSNNPREDITVVVKDASGNDVENSNGETEFTTNENGQVTFQYVIKPGTYTVYEVGANGSETHINSFAVVNTCEAIVKPRPTGGGGGWTPPTDPEDPGDPTDPEKPGPGEPSDPTDPDKPGPEEPNDPADPENPNPEEPEEPGKPTNPTNPENPDGDVSTPPGNNNGSGSVSPPADKNAGSDVNKHGSSNSGNTAKLPQTGEEQFMYMIALGVLFLAAGSIVLFRQRRKA